MVSDWSCKPIWEINICIQLTALEAYRRNDEVYTRIEWFQKADIAHILCSPRLGRF